MTALATREARRAKRNAQRLVDMEAMLCCTKDAALMHGLRHLVKHLNSDYKRKYDKKRKELVGAFMRKEQDKTVAGATRRNKRWTSVEVALLKTLTLTDVEIAKALQRTLFSVVTKRVKLKRSEINSERSCSMKKTSV
jgi:hypothetical protein